MRTFFRWLCLGLSLAIIVAACSGGGHQAKPRPHVVTTTPAPTMSPYTTPPQPLTTTLPPPPTTSRVIGIYVSTPPSAESAAVAELDTVAQMGFNTVLNYSIYQASPDQIRSYLNHAAVDHLQIIFSLKDCYDGSDPNCNVTYPWGSNQATAAGNLVRQFASHPAVWGFYVGDELGDAISLLPARQAMIHAITTKPTLATYQGAPEGDAAGRMQFDQAVSHLTDAVGQDDYPIGLPCIGLDRVGRDASELHQAAPARQFFTIQAMSWDAPATDGTTLSDTADQFCDSRPKPAPAPTVAEMESMISAARQAGVTDFLFFEYDFISRDPQQVAAVTNVVSWLKQRP